MHLGAQNTFKVARGLRCNKGQVLSGMWLPQPAKSVIFKDQFSYSWFIFYNFSISAGILFLLQNQCGMSMDSCVKIKRDCRPRLLMLMIDY